MDKLPPCRMLRRLETLNPAIVTIQLLAAATVWKTLPALPAVSSAQVTEGVPGDLWSDLTSARMVRIMAGSGKHKPFPACLGFRVTGTRGLFPTRLPSSSQRDSSAHQTTTPHVSLCPLHLITPGCLSRTTRTFPWSVAESVNLQSTSSSYRHL